MAQRVIFGFLTSIVFSIVLYAGLSGALFSIDTLFSLEIQSKRYMQLLFLIFGLFGVNYLLSQIPKNPHSLTIHTYTKIEIIFTKYILTPLVIFYFFILYAYTFKVLIEENLPKGILAWIISIFCTVAIITYLFWTPLWSKKAKKYKNLLLLPLFLQTIMLGIAINIRVSAYAWTESRYMIAIFGVWLFGVSLYLILIKNAKYKWIFITLSLLLLVSQIGPFSSYAIGKSSQQNRLQALLKKTQPHFEKSDIKTRYEISNIIAYLYGKHSIESLRLIMPEIVAKFQNKTKLDDSCHNFPLFATNELGFSFVNRRDLKKSRNFFNFHSQSETLNISNYDWLIRVSYSSHSKKGDYLSVIKEIDTAFILTENELEIKESNVTIANILLADFYKQILSNKELKNIKLDNRSIASQNENSSLIYKDKNVSVKIIIDSIYRSKDVKNTHLKVLYSKR